MPYTYSIYGLTLSLPFPCAILAAAQPGSLVDITVLDGQVPPHLEAPIAEAPGWQIEAGRFLFRAGPRAGRFLAEGGSRVSLQRAPAAEDELLALAFLDNVLVALLRQRGNLVLHANSAMTAKGAIAISGESGAGKSTTLTALLQQGCAMLADDISVLRLNTAGEVEVLPGIPQMNLMEDAAHSLDYDISQFTRHQWRHAKAIVPTQAHMWPQPAHLRGLYLLEKQDIEAVRVQSLSGSEKFFATQSCVYGPLLPEEHPGIFPLFAALVEQVPVFRIQRPLKNWSLPEVTSILLSAED